MKRRCGKISVARSLIYDSGEYMAEVFYKIKFVPFRVDYDCETDSFDYYGTSPQFDEIPQGGRSPAYGVVVNYEPYHKPMTVELHKL